MMVKLCYVHVCSFVNLGQFTSISQVEMQE